MRSLFAALFVLCASPALCSTATVGKFRYKLDKDPFGDADRYVALTEQGRAAFYVECVNGKLGLALGYFDHQPFASAVAVKLKADDGPIIEAAGKVVTVDAKIGTITVQFFSNEFIGLLPKAKTVAIKHIINGVGGFFTFNVKGVDKVVADAKKACRVQ